MHRPWEYRDLPDNDLKQMLQKLSQELAHRHAESQLQLRVEFPRGCIRSIGELRARWPYVSSDTRRTLACFVQLSDINRWSLNTWEIGLTAGTMWVWQCCLPVVAIVETLLLHYGIRFGWHVPEARFKKTINTCQSNGLYKQAFRDQLHELREYRNQIHAHLHDKVALHDGLPVRYNAAVSALRILEGHLTAHWAKYSASQS
jgi:hypothetical protein